jgi:hypothetical protein
MVFPFSLVLLPFRQGAQAEVQMPDPLSGSVFVTTFSLRQIWTHAAADTSVLNVEMARQ